MANIPMASVGHTRREKYASFKEVGLRPCTKTTLSRPSRNMLPLETPAGYPRNDVYTPPCLRPPEVIPRIGERACSGIGFCNIVYAL